MVHMTEPTNIENKVPNHAAPTRLATCAALLSLPIFADMLLGLTTPAYDDLIGLLFCQLFLAAGCISIYVMYKILRQLFKPEADRRRLLWAFILALIPFMILGYGFLPIGPVIGPLNPKLKNMTHEPITPSNPLQSAHAPDADR